MKITGLLTFLEDEFTYPVDQNRVIEAVGSTEVEAPDARETETIATIIGSVGQERYETADELYATVIGNVSDEYIGRKFYDDRSGVHEETASGPRDETDVSF